ncbi:MAG: hypothetical protein A2Z11_00195 [Candidatus Woykebacteria bacterium RBG_16_43_9]|uniref:Uncharacterized protein n=1 Tax=Candidatus Woykebacteria bacterium RBG_16_43_9 TaxID=1802596 RepID=A0A1G1WFQ6_9BACT|nr:MAG: hypothetical protein A2Z11_00195 [Candidatus Woykebacteria bacterium RBG_16_43_9]
MSNNIRNNLIIVSLAVAVGLIIFIYLSNTLVGEEALGGGIIALGYLILATVAAFIASLIFTRTNKIVSALLVSGGTFVILISLFALLDRLGF